VRWKFRLWQSEMNALIAAVHQEAAEGETEAAEAVTAIA